MSRVPVFGHAVQAPIGDRAERRAAASAPARSRRGRRARRPRGRTMIQEAGARSIRSMRTMIGSANDPATSSYGIVAASRSRTVPESRASCRDVPMVAPPAAAANASVPGSALCWPAESDARRLGDRRARGWRLPSGVRSAPARRRRAASARSAAAARRRAAGGGGDLGLRRGARRRVRRDAGNGLELDALVGVGHDRAARSSPAASRRSCGWSS